MIAWKTIKEDGYGTLVADLFNVQINRLTFRDVWRKYFTELFTEDIAHGWPLIMCHVTEEPWQLIVYPSRNSNLERNHDAVMSITFIEHNMMLGPVEDCGVCDNLLDTLTEIAADRIIQLAAGSLEDVIKELSLFERDGMNATRIEIWFNTDDRRVAIDRTQIVFPSTSFDFI